MRPESQANGRREPELLEQRDFLRRAGIGRNGKRGLAALARGTIYAALFQAAISGNAGEVLRLDLDDGIVAQGVRLTGATEADVIAVGQGYKKNGLQLKPGSKIIIPAVLNPKEGTVSFRVKSPWEKRTPGDFVFFSGANVDFYRFVNQQIGNEVYQARVRAGNEYIINKQHSIPLPVGEWVSVCLVWNCDVGLTLSMDGKPIICEEKTWDPASVPDGVFKDFQIESKSGVCPVLDDYIVFDRALSEVEVQQLNLGKLPLETGGAPDIDLRASFDDTPDAFRANGTKISGKIGVRLEYVPGEQGMAAVVKRWAYDQKASLVYQGIEFRPAGTMIFLVKPLWDGPPGEHRLALLMGDAVSLGLVSDDKNKLRLVCRHAEDAMALELDKALPTDRFSRVAVSWDFKQGRIALSGNAEYKESVMNTEASPTGTAELWIGSDSSNNFEGSTADAAFDDLALFNSFADGKVMASFFDLVSGKGQSGSLVPLDVKTAGADTIRDVAARSIPNILSFADPLVGFSPMPGKELLVSADATGTEWTIHFSGKLNHGVGEESIFQFACGKNSVMITHNVDTSVTECIVQDKDGRVKKLRSVYPLHVAESFHVAIVNSKDETVFYVNGVPHPLHGSLNEGLSFSSLRVNSKAVAGLSVIVAGAPANHAAMVEACNSLLPPKVPGNSVELTDEEKAVWGVDDAWSRTTATRTELCLNGIWRFEPLPSSSSVGEKLYGKIPGRWLSQTMYSTFELSGGKKQVVKEIHGVSLGKIRSGIYFRSLVLPVNVRGKKLILQCKNIGADCARVFANGKFIGAVSATGKFDQGLMRGFAFEIPPSTDTDPERLDVAVELHFQGESDRSGGSSLLDLSLLAVPEKTSLDDVSVHASIDSSTVTITGRVVDPNAANGALNINCVIKDKDGNELKRFSAPIEGVPQNGGYSFAVSTLWPEVPLWSAETPNIMSACIAGQGPDGATFDEVFPLRLGVRTFETEKDHFVVNGVKTRLFYNSSAAGSFFIRYNSYILGDGITRNILTQLKSAGYNAVGLDMIYNKDMVQWYNHQTPDYHERFLDLCDELGLYVVLHTPEFDEFIDEGEYRRTVAEIAATWGAHPSVIMYLTDFNKTWYAMGQHPAMINDLSYLPEFKRSARQYALRADAIIGEVDPSKVFFHNAAGNLTPLYTTMHYMSFGLPLQEREDWPSQWRKTNLFMCSETGFPYDGQFYDFENPMYRTDVEILVVENAARLIGDEAYRQTERPFDKLLVSLNMDKSTGNDLRPEFLAVKKLLCGNHIRAWRLYDASGIGIFNEESSLFHQTFERYDINETDKANPKTPGAKPDIVHIEPRFIDDKIETSYYHYFSRQLYPVKAYLVDGSARWNAKDHSYFHDEEISKSAIGLNDSLKVFKGTLSIEAKNVETGAVLAERSTGVSIPPGSRAELPLSFTPEPTQAKTRIMVTAKIGSEDGTIVSEESFPLEVHPSYPFPNVEKFQIGVLDTVGDTGNILRQLGVAFKEVKTADDAMNLDVLVVGRNALSADSDRILSEIEKAGAIDQGLDLLIFEQRECNFMNLIFQEERQRRIFVRQPSHRFLEGLDNEDFHDWRGIGDMVVDFDAPNIRRDERSPLYPHFKYTCGAGGIAASYVIRKPQIGNARAILDCGFDLMNSPLIEMNKGAGTVTLCQMDITSRYGKDPVATKLFNNFFRNLTKRVDKNKASSISRLALFDKSGYFSPLETYSSAIETITSLADLSPCKFLLVAGNVDEDMVDAKEQIAGFLDNGGTIIYMGLPVPESGELKWAPGGITYQKKQIFKSTVLPGTAAGSLLAGLAPSDVYFRRPVEVATFSSPAEQGFHPLLDDASIVELAAGEGKIILVGYDASNFLFPPVQVDKTEYHSFVNKLVFRKPFRIVSGILANLGLEYDKIKMFTNTRYQNNQKSSLDLDVPIQDWKFKADPDDIGIDKLWNNLSPDETWTKIVLGVPWEEQGHTRPNPNFAGKDAEKLKSQYDGAAWYSAHVRVPESMTGKRIKSVSLQIGAVDDFDTTYVNGIEVGCTGEETPKWWAAPRSYSIPLSSFNMKEDNLITIRVWDNYGSGKVDDPAYLRIELEPDSEALNLSPYLPGYPDCDLNAFHNW